MLWCLGNKAIFFIRDIDVPEIKRLKCNNKDCPTKWCNESGDFAVNKIRREAGKCIALELSR